MSNDQDQHGAPPDFDANDSSKADDTLFVSAISPTTVDVSLSGGEDDDDDENPFGAPPPAREKTATNTTNIVEAPVENERNLPEPEKSVVDLDEDEDIFGANTPVAAAAATASSSTPVPKAGPTPSTPVKQESSLFSVDTSSSSPKTPVVKSTPSFDSQISSSTPTTTTTKNVLSGTVTASHTAEKRGKDNDIEITVSDPTKVGDGMSSYMTYRITTKTTLPIFKKSEFSVNRRFSDFLGLHAKVVNKHLQAGLFLPSPPEKDTLSMAKVKISNKEEAVPTDFIDRRRALLERYLNRLVQHPKLLEDSDVQTFLEFSNDLPKSTNTQALSGAGVLRVLSNLSNSVTKLTTKTNEQDQWFDEKHTFILDLHTNFKQLYNYFNNLFTQRKESGQALKQLATSLNHLATIEEHTLLSSALIELANVDEKLEQISLEHSCREYSMISELIKEYISLLEMVQLVFQERIKIHQQWLNAEETLKKKRESKIKLEQTSKNADKLPTIEMEIHEWEGKVERGKEDFERISTTIKQELEVFEQIRIDDFRNAIQNYLKLLLEEQEKILEVWENFLPEANKINV